MDWKYKHFHQERMFPASRDVVMEAARTFMTESLGWGIINPADAVNTPRLINPSDGFTAEGHSFSHRAIANLRFQTVAEGTKATIDLMVERAGITGFMLVDVGGYYNIQIRKWLDGIQWSIHQKLTGSTDGSQNPLVLANKKPAACLFNGCLAFIVVTFGLYVFVTFVSAVVGLLTGNLFLLGRGSVTIHGIWARIVAALILIFGAFLVWRYKRTSGKPPAILSLL